MAFRVNSVPGATHRCRQPKWPEPGPNPRDQLFGYQKRGTSLITANAWPGGDKLQSGRVVKAYEYYQTCIATKTFEFFGFLGEARNDTPKLTSCFTNVSNLILLKIGHLCSSFVQAFP